MSKDEQHPTGNGTPPDTAMTMASPEAQKYSTAVTISEPVGSGGASASSPAPYSTEVTISEPASATAAAEEGVPRPTEVTLPMGDRHDTARTELMEAPAVGSGAAFGGLRPGDRIERYVIVKQLGRGGMGAVMYNVKMV